MEVIGADTMFEGSNILANKVPSDDVMLVLLRDTFNQIWEDPKRPDIKPGRRYVLTVQFREMSDDDDEAGTV